MRELLAECRAIDEVKDIHDKAQAIAAYYRQRGASLEIQNDAAEVRLHAERRLGELLKTMPKHRGGRPAETSSSEAEVSPATLGEIGITHKQSSMWQRIAAIAEESFEERIAEAKENGLELTTSRVLGLSKPPKAEAKGNPAPPTAKDAPAAHSSKAEDPDPTKAAANARTPEELLEPLWEYVLNEMDRAEPLAPLIAETRRFLAHLEKFAAAGAEKARGA